MPFNGSLSTSNTSAVTVSDSGMVSNNFTTAAYDNDESSMSVIESVMSTTLVYDYFDTTSEDLYADVYYLTFFDFEVITLGLVRPIIVIITILANIFVVGYFLSGKGRGKSTNLLFVSIAFSDSMSGISLLPNSFNVYIPDNDMLSASACNAYMVWQLYISMAFHTASIWQTVFLGIQRYLCVCHLFISGRICTFWKTFVAIIVVYMMSFVMHIYQLINAITHKYTDQQNCEWRTDDPCKDACLYKWICVIFQHFLPASLLVGLTTKTLITLKKAQRRASSSMSQKTNKKRSSRDKIITITAVLIVICFLVPEVPYGLYKLCALINIYRPTTAKITVETHHIMSSVYEIALLVSFHANFWIYFTMMCDFRRALIHVFTFGCLKNDNAKRLQSFNSYQGKTESFRSSRARTGSVISRKTVLSRSTSIRSTTSDNIHAVNQKDIADAYANQRNWPTRFFGLRMQTKVGRGLRCARRRCFCINVTLVFTVGLIWGYGVRLQSLNRED